MTLMNNIKTSNIYLFEIEMLGMAPIMKGILWLQLGYSIFSITASDIKLQLLWPTEFYNHNICGIW